MVWISDKRLAVCDGLGNALAQQRGQVGNGIAGYEADSDLRGTGIECAAERLAAVIGNKNEGAGRHTFGGNDIGAIHPDVAGF